MKWISQCYLIREEYKEVCDVQLERKNIIKQQAKKSEDMELNKNQQIFEQGKQVGNIKFSSYIHK